MMINSDQSDNVEDEEATEFNKNITSKLGGSNSQSIKELQKVKNTLKQCKGASGVFKPDLIFNCLNDI